MLTAALWLCLQDPTLEEILREFERAQDVTRMSDELRRLPGGGMPLLARRVVDDLARGAATPADRVLLDFLFAGQDPASLELLSQAARNPALSASSRINLLPALAEEDRAGVLEEIAAGTGELADRLRAAALLWPGDGTRAREFTSRMLASVPVTALESQAVRNQVILLARHGSPEANALLWQALGDEALSPEARLAAADAVRRLGDVSNVDLLLRSLAGLQRIGNGETARRAREMEDRLRFDAPSEAVADDAEPAAPRAPARPPRRARAPAEEDVTLERNLTILSLVIILGALLVLARRR